MHHRGGGDGGMYGGRGACVRAGCGTALIGEEEGPSGEGGPSFDSRIGGTLLRSQPAWRRRHVPKPAATMPSKPQTIMVVGSGTAVAVTALEVYAASYASELVNAIIITLCRVSCTNPNLIIGGCSTVKTDDVAVNPKAAVVPGRR